MQVAGSACAKACIHCSEMIDRKGSAAYKQPLLTNWGMLLATGSCKDMLKLALAEKGRNDIRRNIDVTSTTW